MPKYLPGTVDFVSVWFSSVGSVSVGFVSVGFGSVWFGSVENGLAVFCSVVFGPVVFGSVEFGSVDFVINSQKWQGPWCLKKVIFWSFILLCKVLLLTLSIFAIEVVEWFPHWSLTNFSNLSTGAGTVSNLNNFFSTWVDEIWLFILSIWEKLFPHTVHFNVIFPSWTIEMYLSHFSPLFMPKYLPGTVDFVSVWFSSVGSVSVGFVSVGFGSVWFGSVENGLAVFCSVVFGPVVFGSVEFGSVDFVINSQKFFTSLTFPIVLQAFLSNS